MKKYDVNSLIMKNEFQKAKKLILSELKTDSKNHWLITQLSNIFYEERNYKEALKIIKIAIKIKPNCPLTKWHYAGTLDMLRKYSDAIKIYKELINSDINDVAYGKCGEGLPLARTIINDSRYRIGRIYYKINKKYLAIRYIRMYLANRNNNCKSIYNKNTVKKELKIILTK